MRNVSRPVTGVRFPFGIDQRRFACTPLRSETPEALEISRVGHDCTGGIVATCFCNCDGSDRWYGHLGVAIYRPFYTVHLWSCRGRVAATSTSRQVSVELNHIFAVSVAHAGLTAVQACRRPRGTTRQYCTSSARGLRERQIGLRSDFVTRP